MTTWDFGPCGSIGWDAPDYFQVGVGPLIILYLLMWGTSIGIPITLIVWGMKWDRMHFQMSLTTSWAYSQARLYRMNLQEQTTIYKATSRLANVRFLGGATSFLEVFWAHDSAQRT